MPLPGPDTRVVELRVPGLAGTTGVSLLDSTDTVQVAGDSDGRIVRPADRLHRPSPGPVLRALGSSVPRTLEGYLWNTMTSGGIAKTSWALLFPFTLANVAHWMLPPLDGDGAPTRALASTCRALLRAVALLLSLLLVGQLAVISVDLFAAQCLAPQAGCLAAAPNWLRQSIPLRMTVGLLPVAAVVWLLYRVSCTHWHTADQQEPASTTDAALPGHGLRAAANAAVLRCLHTVGMLAMLGVLLVGGPVRVPRSPEDTVGWIAALALVAVSLLGVLVNPARLGGKRGRGALLGVAAAVAIACAIIGAPLRLPSASAGLLGTDSTVEGIGALLVAGCVLFGLLLIPTAMLSRRAWRRRPKRLRPWAGGWAAAPVLVLACLLGGGFGAGTAIALRELVGGDNMHLPESYSLITMLWGGALAVAAVLAVAGFAVALPLRRLRRGIPGIVRLMHSGEHTRAQAAAAWARASWERHWMHRLVLAFVLVMAAGAVALLVARYILHAVPAALGPLSGVGVLALGLLAVGLLRVIFTAATGTGGSRRLGAFADLVSFWPRMAHPAVPPCYALKVLPELNARAKEHLSESDTRVVFAGYHIGGLLATIAAARLAADVSPAQRERIGLVTAGCPLQWGYQRAFPAVFPLDSLATLYGDLQQRWRGLCRGTDTYGGGATSWRHQVLDDTLLGIGYLPDGSIGALPAGKQSANGALIIGGDHWLPDPMRAPQPGHRWAPGVLRNTDYIADPEWDRAVTMAGGLQLPGTVDSPRAEQPSLFTDLLSKQAPPQPRESSPAMPAGTQQDESCGAG